MNKRKTLEEWQVESDRIHNSEFILLDIPKSSHDKIRIIHLKCKNVISSSPRNHIKNYCKYCSGKHKRNIEEWQTESNKIHDFEFKILKLGKNSKSNSEIKHLNCDKVFNQTMNNHINHKNKCPHCSNKIYTLSDLQNRSNKIHNSEYEILKYPNTFMDIIPIKHIKCGNINNQSMSNHILNEKGCYFCNFNHSKSLEELQKLSDNLHNSNYVILEKPRNYNQKIEIHHLKCNNIYEQSMRCHITLRSGCNICNESLGEKSISVILDELGIKYIKEFTFNNCVFKNKLRFDFFLPEYKSCIEYDGIQHFKCVEFFGGDKSLEKNKIRDSIKNEYCLVNNINLIRFNYNDDHKFIKNKIKNVFKN